MTTTRFLAIAAMVAIGTGCGGTDVFEGDAGQDPDVTDPAGERMDVLPEGPPDALPDGSDVGPEAEDVPPDTPGIDRPVDILVVVDNSMSMAEEQARLVDHFPTLIQGILDPTGSHRPVTDLHIGVVSTDMGTGGYSVETCSDPVDGDNGELQNTPNPGITGCDATYPRYLSYDSPTPDATLISWMSTGFACIATLGINGCGFEQQLKASQRALIDHADGLNAGFLRTDSILAVVFLSDEDDCSVAAGSERIFNVMDSSLGHLNLRCFHHPHMIEPVAAYNTAFASLRSAPDDLLLAFIVGVPMAAACEGAGDSISTCLEQSDMIEQVDPTTMSRLVPACRTMGTDATPARRFVQVAQNFGAQAHVQSICNDSFATTVDWLIGRIQTLAGD